MSEPETIDRAITAVIQATNTSTVEMQRALAIWEHCSPTPLMEGGWRMSAAPNQPLITVEVTPFYACSVCVTQGRLCEHALAVLVIEQLRKDPMEPTTVPTMSADIPNATTLPTVVIPRESTVSLHGKDFVTYHGLLTAARQHGLTGLSATFTYNDAELSLAEATATFTDGRCHTESADATPSNVGNTIKPHFRRMALTRAKARALRDALGITEASVEELGGEGTPEEQKPAAVPQMSPRPAPARRPEPPPASADVGPQPPFVAHTLKQDEYQGRVYWKVLGEGLPPRFAKYGISLSPQVAQDCEVDLDESTDIEGWRVEWLIRKDGDKTYANVTKLVDPYAAPADEDDIPF